MLEEVKTYIPVKQVSGGNSWRHRRK